VIRFDEFLIPAFVHHDLPWFIARDDVNGTFYQYIVNGADAAPLDLLRTDCTHFRTPSSTYH